MIETVPLAVVPPPCQIWREEWSTNFLVNTAFYKKIWWKQWMETMHRHLDGMSTFLPAFLGLYRIDRSSSITVMKGGVSCFSHAKNIRTSSRGNDDLCVPIPIPSLIWRDQLRSPQFMWLCCEMTSDGSRGYLFWIFFPAFTTIVCKVSHRAEQEQAVCQAVIIR